MDATILTTALSLAIALLTPADVAVSSQPAPMAGESHCVITTFGQRDDGRLITSDPECFDTFAGAMTEASQGTLRLPAGTSETVLFTDSSVAAAVSAFTLGIHFDGYSGTGSSLTVAGSSCTGGWWNTPSWFDNRISSSSNGCARLKHFDYPNVSGYLAATTGAGTTDNLPSGANNRTESVSYHSS